MDTGLNTYHFSIPKNKKMKEKEKINHLPLPFDLDGLTSCKHVDLAKHPETAGNTTSENTDNNCPQPQEEDF